MKRPRAFLAGAAFAGAFALASPALAQHDSVEATASASASIVPGLAVQKTQDLVLGAFRPGQTFGTVDVDVSDSGGSSRSASGGVALSAGLFSAAQFSVAGSAGPVHIAVVLPSSITIQRIGGGETMTVDRFRSNVSPDCRSGSSPQGCPSSPYTLVVGATLHVDPNQAAGQYVGTFTVTVNQL